MSFERLKERHRAERHDWPENLSLRVHRALSWLHRAEQLARAEDIDGQFIFLWIAFNAAYATEIDEKYRESEQQTFRAFLQKLTELVPASGGSTRWSGRSFRRASGCCSIRRGVDAAVGGARRPL